MARVPAFTIQPSANATSLSLPHFIGANRTYAEATRTLSCAPKRHTNPLARVHAISLQNEPDLSAGRVYAPDA